MTQIATRPSHLSAGEASCYCDMTRASLYERLMRGDVAFFYDEKDRCCMTVSALYCFLKRTGRSTDRLEQDYPHLAAEYAERMRGKA